MTQAAMVTGTGAVTETSAETEMKQDRVQDKTKQVTVEERKQDSVIHKTPLFMRLSKQ